MSGRVAFAALLLALGNTTHAQDVDELRRLLKERDAKIRELTERVEALEESKRGKDDEELNRALERTLVLQGALLLRPRTYEVEPQVAYAYWDKDRPPFQHQSELALALRAGLPWESQFQVRIPYVHVATTGGSATALGDASLSLTRQVVTEGEYSPGIFAAVGWTARTGRDGFDGNPSTGGGFNVLQAGVTGVKRHDPLVSYAGVSYADSRARRIEGSRIDPGSTVGVRLGSILAASADTSLNIGLNLGFTANTRVDGQPVPGSDSVSSTLSLGFATILGGGAILNLTGDFRVSGNVPNFRLGLGVPIRF